MKHPNRTFTIDPDLGQQIDVVIVGCGGTGGFAAEALCRLFTGREDTLNLVLVDHDIVEPHNLLRQNFYAPDVGRNKAQALAERLSGLFDRRVAYYRGRFQRKNHTFPGMSGGHYDGKIILGCVDNATARRNMEQALSMTNGRSWYIDSGNGEKWGQVLIGSTTSTAWIRNCVRNGRVRHIPSPGTQRPELLVQQEEAEPDIDCAAALDLTDQDPNINRIMASLITMAVNDLIAGTCSYMALNIDTGNPLMRATPITVETLAHAASLSPAEINLD